MKACRDSISQTPDLSSLIKIFHVFSQCVCELLSTCYSGPLCHLVQSSSVQCNELDWHNHYSSFSILFVCPPANWCWCFFIISPCPRLQFNCTYRKAEVAPPPLPWPGLDVQLELVENVTFSMELYNTSLFRHPQPPSFLQVMENKPVFVEVTYGDNSYNTFYAY